MSMRVIEFCGTPGCGKTTLCKELIKEFKNKGFAAFDYNELKTGKFKAVCHYFFKKGFLGTAFKLFFYNGFINRDRLVYGIKIAVVNAQIKDWSSEGKCDYLFFDEGILQYITTLSHGKEVSNLEKLPVTLKALYSNADTYVVHCNLDVETNITRLSKRGNEGDRYVIDDKEKQLKALQLKADNISKVVEFFAPANKLETDVADSDIAKANIMKFVFGEG